MHLNDRLRACCLVAAPHIAQGAAYVPPPESWAARPAAAVGLDADALIGRVLAAVAPR